MKGPIGIQHIADPEGRTVALIVAGVRIADPESIVEIQDAIRGLGRAQAEARDAVELAEELVMAAARRAFIRLTETPLNGGGGKKR